MGDKKKRYIVQTQGVGDGVEPRYLVYAVMALTTTDMREAATRFPERATATRYAMQWGALAKVIEVEE